MTGRAEPQRLEPGVSGNVSEPNREYMVRVRRMRLHVVEWGDPRNVPVLLLHGRSANAIDMQRLGARLAERHRVVAFDQRGHGLSDWPGRYTQRLLVGDVESVVDATGLRRFALIGHSMGGGIAWAYAGRHPDTVRRLVLLDSSPEPPGVHEPDDPAPPIPTGWTTPDEMVAWAASLGWTKRIGRQDVGRWLTRYARPGPNGSLDAAYDASGYDRAYVSGSMWPSNRAEWRTISRVTCPTLVVIGEHGAVGRELGMLLARRLRHGELAVVPRAGHAVHLENLPATLGAVRTFLASLK
jgi:pimeloyl-ACP methyl ester carboxylesterase